MIKKIFNNSLLALSFLFVFVFTYFAPSAATEAIPLHDLNGKKCHTPYDDPNDCRHIKCDHVFCNCMSQCNSICEVASAERCQECNDECWGNHAQCYNKCCDDGKIDC